MVRIADAALEPDVPMEGALAGTALAEESVQLSESAEIAELSVMLSSPDSLRGSSVTRARYSHWQAVEENRRAAEEVRQDVADIRHMGQALNRRNMHVWQQRVFETHMQRDDASRRVREHECRL